MPKDSWMFSSTSARQKIGAQKIQPEKRYSSGQIEQATKVITFDEHIYRTEKKMEADVIRGSHSFMIGKVKEIGEFQYKALMSRKAAVTGVATTQDHFITEEDKKRAVTVALSSVPPQLPIKEQTNDSNKVSAPKELNS